MTVALCDSPVPGHGHGALSVGTLEMVSLLADEPGPVVAALHHPPVPVGHPAMDRIALQDPSALEALLRPDGAPLSVVRTPP